MKIQQLRKIAQEMTSLAKSHELLKLSVEKKEFQLDKIERELASKLANTASSDSAGIQAISQLRIEAELLPAEIERDESELKSLRAEFTAKYDSIKESLHKHSLGVQARFAKSYKLFLAKHGVSAEEAVQACNASVFQHLPAPNYLRRLGWCITGKDFTAAAHCLSQFLSLIEPAQKTAGK